MKDYQEIRPNPISTGVILWSFHTPVPPFCGSNILRWSFSGVIHNLWVVMLQQGTYYSVWNMIFLVEILHTPISTLWENVILFQLMESLKHQQLHPK